MSIVVCNQQYHSDPIRHTSGVASHAERRNTSKTTQFGYTPPAETAVAPKPEVALPLFSLHIEEHCSMYTISAYHNPSGVASDDETLKDVKNNPIWAIAVVNAFLAFPNIYEHYHLFGTISLTCTFPGVNNEYQTYYDKANGV